MLAEGRRLGVARRDDLVRLGGRALLLLGVAYLVYSLAVGLDELSRLEWRRYVGPTVVGFALYPLSLGCQAVAWALALGLLRRNRLTVEWPDLRIYASSHLARRLPGGVWHLVARVGAYRRHGVAASAPIVATVGELVVLTGAAGAVYLAAALLPPVLAPLGALVGGAAVGGGVGVAIARARGLDRRAAVLAYGAVAGLDLVALVTGGAILWGFLGADASPVDAAATWAAVAGVGTVLGLIPGIVAARELTLFFVLVGPIGAPAAAAVALLLRVLFVAADLAWGTALLLLARRLERSRSVY